MATIMPSGLEYWTADEVAVVLSYGKYLPDEYDEDTLYKKLWSFIDFVSLDNDDKDSHWWHKLTDVEAKAISQAYLGDESVL